MPTTFSGVRKLARRYGRALCPGARADMASTQLSPLPRWLLALQGFVTIVVIVLLVVATVSFAAAVVVTTCSGWGWICDLLARFGILTYLPETGFSEVSQSETSRLDPSQPQARQPDPSRLEQWLDGGTLHHATMKQFYHASHPNKLATCGGIVVRALEFDGVTMDKLDPEKQVKPWAAALVREMDRFYVRRRGTADNVPVADVASFLWVTMNQQLDPFYGRTRPTVPAR